MVGITRRCNSIQYNTIQFDSIELNCISSSTLNQLKNNELISILSLRGGKGEARFYSILSVFSPFPTFPHIVSIGDTNKINVYHAVLHSLVVRNAKRTGFYKQTLIPEVSSTVMR